MNNVNNNQNKEILTANNSAANLNNSKNNFAINNSNNLNNLNNNNNLSVFPNKDLNTIAVGNPTKIVVNDSIINSGNAGFNVISELNSIANNLGKSSLAANLSSKDLKNFESISKEKESFIVNNNANFINSKSNANLNSSVISQKSNLNNTINNHNINNTNGNLNLNKENKINIPLITLKNNANANINAYSNTINNALNSTAKNTISALNSGKVPQQEKLNFVSSNVNNFGNSSILQNSQNNLTGNFNSNKNNFLNLKFYLIMR